MAAVMSEPQQFSPQAPASAWGRIIDEHQSRIKGVKQENGYLADDRNETDSESGNGNHNTEKGDFKPLPQID